MTAPNSISSDTETDALSYDEKIEMLRMADDIVGGEVSEFDQSQSDILVRALRLAGATDAAQGQPDRTAIARIVDPEAMTGSPRWEIATKRESALAKADAILALSTSPSSPGAGERKQAYETVRHIIGHLEGNCGLCFSDLKQDDWDTLTNLVASSMSSTEGK